MRVKLNVQFDEWTSTNKFAWIGITISYVNLKNVTTSRLLALKRIDAAAADTPALRGLLDSVFLPLARMAHVDITADGWVDSLLATATTDTASTVLKVFKLDFPHIRVRCFDHLNDLSIKDQLPKAQRAVVLKEGFNRAKPAREPKPGCPAFIRLIGVAKAITDLFPSVSTKRWRAYRTLYTTTFPSDRVVILPHGVQITRWCSHYMSILRMLETWFVVVSCCCMSLLCESANLVCCYFSRWSVSRL